MSVLDDSEIQDFWAVIGAAGYSKDDFDLSEVEDNPQTTGMYAIRGKAIVRRKSTSIAREYRAGHGTAWVEGFKKELRGGVFGPA